MNKIKDLEEEYSTIDKDTDDDDMIKLKQCIKSLLMIYIILMRNMQKKVFK